MQACSQLISAGASSTAAIQLGKGNQEKAEKIVGNAFILSFLLAILLSAIGLLCLDPLLKLYGADSENILYAHDYAGVMFAGAICFVLSQSMNSIVRGMGYAKRSLINFLSSIVINLILDAIFVLVFKWGVKGAAFATKAAPRSLFLCTGPAPAGAFRSATERSEALGAEIGTFLFLFQEKKKCGAQPFPLFQEEKNPSPVAGRNHPPLF